MYRFLLLALVWPFALALADTLEIPEVPTKAQAEAMIAAEMAAGQQREADRKAAIEAVPAVEEWELDQGDRKTIIRQIAPPVPEATVKSQISPAVAKPWTEEEIAAWMADQPIFRNLNVTAVVFDRTFTELTWRDADRLEWTILSNIDFRYLGGIGHFEDESHHWMTFIFVYEADSEKERIRASLAADMGFPYEARSADRWLSLVPADFLSRDRLEYFVFAEQEAAVPAALYEELDALHRYYDANEAQLKASYERNKVLNEARRAWHEANPPETKDGVMNFWKIR